MRVVSFKAPVRDHERWKGEAKKLRLSFGEWVRRKLDDDPVSVVPLLVKEAPSFKAKQPARCEHRLPPGTYCKRCERVKR